MTDCFNLYSQILDMCLSQTKVSKIAVSQPRVTEIVQFPYLEHTLVCSHHSKVASIYYLMAGNKNCNSEQLRCTLTEQSYYTRSRGKYTAVKNDCQTVNNKLAELSDKK